MSAVTDKNYAILSREEVGCILEKIKICVDTGEYIISSGKNRKENNDFIREYNLTVRMQENILLGLEIEDFCYTLQNKNKGFEQEILYVFSPSVELISAFGLEEMVDIYIKFNLMEAKFENMTIVISFHRRNKPIAYCFK